MGLCDDLMNGYRLDGIGVANRAEGACPEWYTWAYRMNLHALVYEINSNFENEPPYDNDFEKEAMRSDGRHWPESFKAELKFGRKVRVRGWCTITEATPLVFQKFLPGALLDSIEVPKNRSDGRWAEWIGSEYSEVLCGMLTPSEKAEHLKLTLARSTPLEISIIRSVLDLIAHRKGESEQTKALKAMQEFWHTVPPLLSTNDLTAGL